MSYSWHSFLWSADEWFITYSLPPLLSHVKLFAVGHSVELYLKAAYTQMTGQIEDAVSFGHQIMDILDACKAHDSGFMPSYEIRESILESGFYSSTQPYRLEGDDLRHYGANQELYYVARMLPDLRYLGAPLRTIRGPYGLPTFARNSYWIGFLREIRSYLNYPRPDLQDVIWHHLEEGDLPAVSSAYLQQLYQ